VLPSLGLVVITTDTSSMSLQLLADAASLNFCSILGHFLPVAPLALAGFTTNTHPLSDVATDAIVFAFDVSEQANCPAESHRKESLKK